MRCRSRRGERPADLPAVLAEWAERLPSKKKVAPLSPDQLYAVILAPAMYAGTSAACRRCGRSATIDLQAVARKFGPGFPIERLKKRLRCTGCRAWNAEIRFVHDGTPQRTGGR